MSTDDSNVATQSFGGAVTSSAAEPNPLDGGLVTESAAALPPSAPLGSEQDSTSDALPKKRDTFDPYRFGRIQFSTQVFRRLLSIPLPEVPEEDLIRKGEASLGAIPVRPIQRAAPGPSAETAGPSPRVLPLLFLVLGLGGLGGFLLLRSSSSDAPSSAAAKPATTVQPKVFKVTLPRSEGRTKEREATSLSTPAKVPAQALHAPLGNSSENEGASGPSAESPPAAPSEPGRSSGASSGKTKVQSSSKSKAWFEVR